MNYEKFFCMYYFASELIYMTFLWYHKKASRHVFIFTVGEYLFSWQAKVVFDNNYYDEN